MTLQCMEQQDIEARNRERLFRPISLRKCSFAVCLLEALAIIVFVYLLLNSGRIAQVPSKPSALSANNSYRLLFDADGLTNVSFLLQPIAGCTMRGHDLQQTVVCRSSEAWRCEPVEQPWSSQADIQESAKVEPGQLATVISTSRAGNRLHKQLKVLNKVECKPQLEAHRDPCRFATRLVVDLQERRQQIIGWGGALTDSSIQNILALTINGTSQLLDDYFGPDGHGYNMIRITIGGSDFSARFYTNDDSLRDDFGLNKFRLRKEDLLYKIPLLKLIMNQYSRAEGNQIKLFGSMWSPPTWMKTNGHFNKGFMKGSISAEKHSSVPPNEMYFEALAELKAKFLLAYQNEIGHKFWGLTVMNEPLFAVQPFLNFNTMIFPREDYANYVVKYLGPKLRQNQQLKHIKLIAHDDNRRFLLNYTMPILANQEAKNYIDGVATHSYVDEAYELLDLVYKKYHKTKESDFFVLPTELCSGHLPFMEKALVGNWHRGVHYALDIIRSLQHSAAGWVDWNMVLDTEGGPGWLGGRLDAPIIVDKQRDLYHRSPMFYVLGQFARYIRPGSVRLQTKAYNDNYDNHLEVVTFALPNDEQLATVVVNNNPYPIDLKLNVFDSKNARSYTNIYYSYTCEQDSVTTIIYSNKI